MTEIKKEKLKVVFLSEWLSNPYKDLLSKNLQEKGLEVEETRWQTFFTTTILNSGKPNILHLHTLHPFLRGKTAFSKLIKLWIFVGQILFLKLLGIKTVWTVHEWADKLDTGVSEISPDRAAIIGKVLHGLIVHCESTKNDIITNFKLSHSNKTHIIPHGNYVEFYENKISPQKARQSLKIPHEHTTFLIFGGIYRHKGVLEALEAFKKLESTQVTLIIAGKPNEKGLQDEIQSEIQGCLKNIIFVPKHIPDRDIQIYMNACDSVVVPYKVFTTSGVAVLAMSFERICIAPDLGFFHDTFVENGAFLYNMGDPDGLLKAMSKTIDHKSTISEKASHNLKLVKEWSWNYVASETISVYDL